MQIADSLFQPPVGLYKPMSKPIETNFNLILSYRIMKSSVEVVGTSCKDTEKNFVCNYPSLFAKSV